MKSAKSSLLLVLLSLVCTVALAQRLDDDLTPEFKRWQVANPWFGADPERTEFARNYARQLQKERPELVGRPLLDAVSKKVAETFGPAGKAQKR